ncbi:MAG: thioredoxin [Ruminococcus bromii]|nr:thioredoxin [Ruminococcus bromii]
MVEKIYDNNMDEVLESKLALVDFSATWCGPCQMLAPIIEELSDELDGEVDFYNADSDENMELAQEYDIHSIPALLLFKNGEVVARTVGFQPKEAIKSFIEANK